MYAVYKNSGIFTKHSCQYDHSRQLSADGVLSVTVRFLVLKGNLGVGEYVLA